VSGDSLLDNVASMIVFARVVEAGSFTAAAKRLGASKAHVSKQVAALERRLGAQLLRRTTRQMNLTEVGQLFYDRCARVAEEAEEAERSVQRMHAAPRGEIRFTAPMSFGLLHLARLVPKFLERHPECRVDLRVSDAYADLIEERFDLAVRIGTLPDSTFVARKFAPIRLAIAASPAYLAGHGRPTQPEDLRDHECLNYLARTDLWTFTHRRKLEVGGRLNISNGDALRAAALSGAGIVYLPTFLIGDDLAAGRLELLLEEHVPQLHSAYAVYPASRHLSPKVRAMIDFLVESFGSRPPWDAYLGGGDGGDDAAGAS
jgi:DNA-binding transcriptional LysR family regulator